MLWIIVQDLHGDFHRPREKEEGAVSLRGSEAVLFLWIKNIPKTPETIKESGICSIM